MLKTFQFTNVAALCPSTGSPPPSNFFLLLADGASFLLLADGSSKLILS